MPVEIENASPPLTSSAERKFTWQRVVNGQSLTMLALGVCWLMFFNEIRGEWETNPQYNYGYVVPLLSAALFWRRWPDRPSAVPGRSPLLGLWVVALLLLQLPFSVAAEANPEWRLLYWTNGLQVLGLSLGLLYYWGGWRWVRHFATPLAFTLIAVPWPMQLEQWAIQGLMKFVAGLTVGIVNLMSIPAVQHGNLIEVGAGIVGIDEACSGVRSLQSALMLSLFLGELYRFSWPRRFALMAACLMFVVLANLTRTTILVWLAANQGLHQMESWHDTAGTLIMVIVLPSLLGLAYLMQPKRAPAIILHDQTSDAVQGISRWVGISVLAWLVAVQVTTEMWYRVHEAHLIPSVPWSVQWPVNHPGFKKTNIPPTSLAILRCSDSDAATWQDEMGYDWSAFVLQWKPGKNSVQLAKGHRPDICFPAAGARLVDDFGLVTVDVNGVDMNFRHYSFASGEKLMHVFYCLWSDKTAPHELAVREDGSEASRIDAILEGKRNLGQRVLEIVVQGPDSSKDAISLLKGQLPMLIKRD
jgi:exosortase